MYDGDLARDRFWDASPHTDGHTMMYVGHQPELCAFFEGMREGLWRVMWQRNQRRMAAAKYWDARHPDGPSGPWLP